MIDEIVARIRSQCSSFAYQSVEHAWDTEPVEVTRESLPRAFIFPGDESTQGDGTSDLVSKRLQKTATVYIVCSIDKLERMKTEVRTALHGWNPDSAAGYDDLELVAGNLVNLKGSVAWWSDTYGTWITLRETYA